MQIYAATTKLIDLHKFSLFYLPSGGAFSERGRRAFNYIRLGVEWSASQCALEAIRKICDRVRTTNSDVKSRFEHDRFFVYMGSRVAFDFAGSRMSFVTMLN